MPTEVTFPLTLSYDSNDVSC